MLKPHCKIIYLSILCPKGENLNVWTFFRCRPLPELCLDAQCLLLFRSLIVRCLVDFGVEGGNIILANQGGAFRIIQKREQKYLRKILATG